MITVKLFVKEKGEFKFKGLYPNVFRASAVGKYLTGTGISRSFKILGGKGILPTGYRKSKKKGQGNVFVELPKTALSQTGEQFVVQTARVKKKGLKVNKKSKRKMKGGKD